MSTKRRIAKKELMEAKRRLKLEQKSVIQKQQEETETLEWLEQNYWNYPNDYVALAFLAYNGIEDKLSMEQVWELESIMYENIKNSCHRDYWTYSCGYWATSLWDYDREKGTFTRKETAPTLDFVHRVVGSFDSIQLSAVFPLEVVSLLLSLVSEEEKRKKIYAKK